MNDARSVSKGPRCGTVNGYAVDRCRCEPCRVAWRDCQRERRSRLKPAPAFVAAKETETLLRRSEELAAITNQAEGELADLIREQEEDDKWGHRVSQLAERSLDAQVIPGRANSESRHEIIGVPDPELVELEGGDDWGVRRIPRPQKWTRPQILKHIRLWTNEHGEPPRYKEWKSPDGRGFPSTASVARVFGSWTAAIEAAGFEPRPVGGTSHPEALKHKRLIPRIRSRKRTAHLTPEQIAAAYVLYERHELSTTQLAERLFRKYGYSDSYSCRTALLRAFHAEGFRLRTRSESLILWHRNKGHRAKVAA